MLLLPWIGTRDDVDLLGYLIERCPSCATVGPFGLYDAKKRLTLATIPGRVYRRQLLLECKTCHARFGVPPEMQESLTAQLLTQDELSERIKHLGGPGAAGRPGAAGPPSTNASASNGHRSFYQVLQVDPSADPEVIEAAFKRLALKYHPDRSTAADAAERTRELIEARDTLTDPHRRAAYDASLGLARRPASAPQPPQPQPRQPQPNRPPPAPQRPRPPAMRPDEV